MYWLHWDAPEGETARAELDGTLVAGNAPVPMRTWWGASVLAAKIAYGNESLTDRVCRGAEHMDQAGADQRVGINGWTFWITDADKEY